MTISMLYSIKIGGTRENTSILSVPSYPATKCILSPTGECVELG
jgi:hypothetical protein